MDAEDFDESIEERINEAFDCIDAGDYDSAIRIGRQLKEQRPAWACEIIAIAHGGKGDTERAIAVLEQGVAEQPDVWRLWQLLGNFYSDRGEFEKCHDAYHRGFGCTEADESSIHLNFAIALIRQENYVDALHHLNGVTDPQIKLQALDMRLEVFNRLEWHTHAIELGRRVTSTYHVDESDEDSDEDSVQAMAKVHAELGLALWLGRQDGDEALECAWRAIGMHKGQHTAMWLVRELDGETSPSAFYYQLTIRGTWMAPVDCDGVWQVPEFVATYEVVADTPKEALDLVASFEPSEVRASLEIEACQVVEECHDQPKGVYVVPEAYQFYSQNDGE